MVGKKIRAFREFRGYSQIQLAELSGINVGTIRKYELGIRNPKPDQLEKIATALGLNVSVFLDFNIETVGDVLSLLFSIDDSVNLSLAETPDQKVSLTFDNPTMQDFFRKWCQFKNVYEKEKAEILAIEDEYKRQEEKIRIGGIDENTRIKDFNYFKLEFSNKLIKEFESMQNKYVLNDKYKLSIDEVKNILKQIYNKILKL